jgi:tetratricopeptide (TPR) repeat protein
MGVLYDNIQEHARAIKCYERFLGVLQGASDQFAEALAHNCIGVSMQLRGPRWYKHALFHHGRHLQLALDYSGQFIARTNIGLLHNTKYLDNTSEAHASHEHALRCAEAMQSEAARSIALGNLGLTALHDKHVGNEDAEKYIAEHYDLSARSKDKEGRAVASDMLGRIAQEQGDYEKAADFFRESYDLQRDQGRAESLARINLGVALGELSVQHFMQSEVPALFGSTSRPLSAVQ